MSIRIEMSGDIDNLEELLEQLGEESGALPVSSLYTFSDLSGDELARFRVAWDSAQVTTRRRIVQAMVELAEATFEVNFDAIFRHCLGDRNAEVRAAAIDGLWENEEVALIGPLLTMLRNDPSAQVRAAAATGLGRYVLAGELEELEPPVQLRILTELLTRFYTPEESVEVRRRAVESAAYACTPEVVEAVEEAYGDDDDQMRLSAVVGMGRSCDKRWKDIILEELQNRHPAMRYEAALAAGGLMLKDAVPLLSGLVEDTDPQIREATIWALGQIGGAQARQVLLSAYEDADAETQAILEEALAEQALLDGNLEFMLYVLEEEENDDLFDDEFLYLWRDEEDDEDDLEPEDW
jgi:HEAT repeat protein